MTNSSIGTLSDLGAVTSPLPDNQLGATYLYPRRSPISPSSVNDFLSVSEDDEDGPVRQKRKVDLRGRHWFLTWNNYERMGPGVAIRMLKGLAGVRKYVIQEETGANGTPHLQGVVTFQHAKLWSQLTNVTGVHCRWALCRNLYAAKQYCRKVHTRTGRVYVLGYTAGARVVRDPLEGKDLYMYQERVIEIVQGEPDERKIYWFYSFKGGIGKSALVKHLCLRYDAMVTGGRMADAHYAIAEKVKKHQDPDIILFDIPRSEGRKCCYAAIEGIKNGCFFTSKYESGMCLFNTPHIIIFANESPDRSKLSDDRWVVQQLDNELDLLDI